MDWLEGLFQNSLKLPNMIEAMRMQQPNCCDTNNQYEDSHSSRSMYNNVNSPS